MSDGKCGVVMLSGFLGSGKTTMLKNFLSSTPENLKVVVLVNEFGKVGVDGDVLREEGLEIVEINRGSIFCACAKGDFLRALYSIRRNFLPDILFVEASGVADTRDLERDLAREGLADCYQLVENICVADAERYMDWADIFNAVPKQIESASLIVVNKTDLVDARQLELVRAEIRSINRFAKIVNATFGVLGWDVIMAEVEKLKEDDACRAELPDARAWEAFIDAVLEEADAHLVPLDTMLSESIEWQGSAIKFKKLLAELPSDVVRAKGYFLDENAKWASFDLVEGRKVTFSAWAGATPSSNLAVFIRKKMEHREMPRIFAENELHIINVFI